MTDTNDTQATPDPAPPGFDAFPISNGAREALREAGFDVPLPVQRAAFEPLRAGRDALIQAPTGTGKTIAFGLPLLEGLTPVPQTPQILVLTPTRELAIQVHGEMTRLAERASLRLALCYGGVGVEPQLQALRGAHGIVGTPGRVLDLLDRHRPAAAGLRILVLDEADQLLSMGFEPDIEAIVQRFPGRYQGIFCSATIPPDILRLAERFLRDPALVSLPESGMVPPEIRHEMFLIDPANRRRDLVRILEAERPDNSFIFCNTRDDCQLLAGYLREHGFPVGLLSGELSQHEREKVMKDVRDGKIAHLVATDLAARGLDVLHLTHIIHYQFPQSPELYVHRSGRVGRVGQPGTSIALVGPQDVATLYMLRLTYGIRPLERRLPSDTEVAREREVELVRGLLDRYADASDDDASLALLRRLRTHVRGEAVLAAVLREHLDPEALREGERRAEEGRRREAQRAARPEAGRPPLRRARGTAADGGRGAAPASPGPARPAGPPVAASEEGDDEPAGPGDDAPEQPGESATEGEAKPRRRRRRRRPETKPAEGPEATGGDAAAEEPTDGAAEESPPPRAAPEPRPEPEDALPSRSATGKEMRNVFLNVGSDDGVDPDFLGQWLQGRLALRSSEFGPVKVRERSTIVAVPADRVTDAIGALAGLRFGGREVTAEEARRR